MPDQYTIEVAEEIAKKIIRSYSNETFDYHGLICSVLEAIENNKTTT